MDYTKNLITLSLAFILHKLLFPGVASLECGPPFFPMNGSHTNVKQKYTPGEKIEYSCDKGYHRVGERQSTCLTNGSWRGYMPFCDPLLQLLDPMLEGNPSKLLHGQRVKDRDTATCLQMNPGDGLRIGLKDQTILQVIKLFLKKGQFDVHIKASIKGKERSIPSTKGTLAKDNWISFDCEPKILADSICIRAKQHSTLICEVEVYGSDELSCNVPPQQLHVPNGHFIVNRERAILKCNGSKGKKYDHCICEDKKWKLIGKPFACEGNSDASETSHKKLVKIIIGSVVAVCLVLGCLIAVLVFLYKKRQTPFVVVMHPKEHYCRGGHAPFAPSAPEEAEYATVIYSDIPLTPSQIRKIPRNVPANLPDLLEYADPQDEDNLTKEENMNSCQTKVYIQPQDALPSVNSQNFASLKQSSFYGN